MRRTLLITVLLLAMHAWSAPFSHTYKNAPLYEVLLDIETHFDCSFLYRPQDIAAALAVTATFNTTDYNEVLRQALGEALTVTARNNILIITPAPKKATAAKQAKKPAQVKQPVPTEVTTAPDTILVSRAQEEPLDTTASDSAFLPEQILRPSPEPFYIRIDTFSIAQRVQLEPLSIQVPAVSSQPSSVSEQKQTTTTQKKKERYGPYMFRHAFQGTGHIGYGSELQASIYVQYTYFFREHWGIGSGINFTYGMQYAPDRDYKTIVEEGRFNIPLTMHTQWMFTDKWGLHASAGISASFPSTSTFITHKTVDGIAIASVMAAHPFTPTALVLFGIYANMSVTAVQPWSAGVQFGVRVGK